MYAETCIERGGLGSKLNAKEIHGAKRLVRYHGRPHWLSANAYHVRDRIGRWA
jgi:hypothetical protein